MKFRKILATLILATATLAPKAFATDDDAPLMIIRFNQEFVNYEKQLQKVVESAASAKSSVFFDLVAIVPETDNRSDNRLLKKNTEYLTAKVTENIERSGISADKIRVTYQDSKVVDSSEVHIFVR